MCKTLVRPRSASSKALSVLLESSIPIPMPFNHPLAFEYQLAAAIADLTQSRVEGKTLTAEFGLGWNVPVRREPTDLAIARSFAELERRSVANTIARTVPLTVVIV